MDRFDAGTLDGVPVSFDTTVYGPVQGTVTVRGKPYAITLRRSTYAQDGLSVAALRDMTLGRARHPANFFRAANEFGFTFNWVYANRRRTAYFSSGLLPRRPRRRTSCCPRAATAGSTGRPFFSAWSIRTPSAGRMVCSATGTTSPPRSGRRGTTITAISRSSAS